MELDVSAIKRVSIDGREYVAAVDVVRCLTGGTDAAARKHLQRLMARNDLPMETDKTRAGKPRLVCDAACAAKLVLVSPCSASMETRMRFAAELSDAMGGDGAVTRAAQKIIATIPATAREYLGTAATPADLVALAPAAALVEETSARFDEVRAALRGMRETHAASERRTRLEIDGIHARLDALEAQLRALVE